MQDILLLSGLPLSKPTVRYAAELAGLWNGQLTGLHVCAPLSMQLDPARPAAMSMQLQWEQDRLARARAAADDFERCAGTASHGRCSWKTATGALAEVVASIANWHDLLLVQRGAELPGGSMASLAQLILTSAVPVMVLPPTAEPLRLGRIAVLWDGTPEATRALHAALASLRTATAVAVFANAGDEANRGNFNLAQYLQAHAVAHSVHAIDSSTLTAARVLTAIAEFQPDLLVLGARGNGRFGEWRLDGFCGSLIETAHIPVLTAS